MHIPGARIAERFGPKLVAVTAQIVTIVITFITPTVASLGGATGLIILRIIMGVFQGGFFPALNTILAAWIPPKQRGKLGALAFNGLPVSEMLNVDQFQRTMVVILVLFCFIQKIGSIAGRLFSGQLLHWYGDWHTVFYYFTATGLALTILFVSNTKPHYRKGFFKANPFLFFGL